MSDPNLRVKDDKVKTERRNLPSWMKSNESENKSHGKRQIDSSSQGRPRGLKEPDEARKRSPKSHHGEAAESSLPFSELLKDVVFVLSGFVNPDRGTLRSQAIEMGAEYRPDWTSDCTLLVCAFPNTPKFRQVEADCGTIVSKDWIAECYNQRKLVEIDRYLMHAGKPWRKNNGVPIFNQERENNLSGKVKRKHESKPLQKITDSLMSESGVDENIKHLPPSKVKEWAIDDLTRTVSWLEKQEERPEPDEIKKIAAEGIITCLQDTIEALDRRQDIQSVTEQWMFVPWVVKELAKLDCGIKNGSLTKEELSKLALDYKHVYEAEYYRLGDYPTKNKRPNVARNDPDYQEQKVAIDNEDSDSDSTIEMTEEEIDLAYKGLSCS